jgi:hypothetical protein
VSFYCKPYLLKLRLPHEVLGTGEEEENCKAAYDPDKARTECHGDSRIVEPTLRWYCEAVTPTSTIHTRPGPNLPTFVITHG